MHVIVDSVLETPDPTVIERSVIEASCIECTLLISQFETKTATAHDALPRWRQVLLSPTCSALLRATS